jgi:hypothetical protein
MVSRSVRFKILNRIAQAQGTPAVAPTTSITTPVATPAPPPFQASSAYPGIRQGFNAASVQLIDQLCGLLNLSLQYASNGAVNFQVFRNNNFNFSASDTSNMDQKNLMLFSKMLYHSLLNSGNPFEQPLTAQQVQVMIQRLETSQPLMALAQTNPTGPIAQKVPGNLKTNILAYLQYLAAANPAAQR